MIRDIDAIELLVLWHNYESGWSPVEGYPTECPSTRGYRTSRQYDDNNGAFETDARGKLAAHIGHVIRSIDDPWRTALCILARNRATGAQVWTSPRLPADKDARVHLVAEAVDMFAAKL